MKKFILLFTLSTFLSLSFAQDKKSITHEAMWKMKRVGAPAVSPYGNWVVFSVTEPSYDEKEQVNDLWIVSSSGNSAPRKLTGLKSSESSYTWSPDGKYIAFVAKRDADEDSQIYLLNMKEGGEAQKFTSLSGGASSPKFSPTGNMILFGSRVYPGCYTDSLNKAKIEEVKKRKYKARVYTTFPIRSFDRWLDEKQSHLFVQNIEEGSAATNLFRDVKMSEKAGFSYYGATWSPDGKDILFSGSENRDAAAYMEPNTQVYSLSISGGDAKVITTGPLDHAVIGFSKDGKYLMTTENPNNNGKVFNLNKLLRFDWPTMTNKTFLAPNLDRDIDGYEITDAGLALVVEDAGRQQIRIVNIQTGESKVHTKEQRGCFTGISSAEKSTVLVSNYENMNMPTEVVKVNDDGTHTFLTSFNKANLDTLKFGEIETFWITNKAGKKIRSMVVKPGDFDPSKKYPLFVVMHGGPHSAWKENWGYRWNYHLLAKPGYALVLTDYRGSTGYGEKFAQSIQLDPFRGPGNDINDAAAYAIKNYSFIDGSRQAAGGASYGGHLASWMEASTTHYKCLINHAGLMNAVSQWATSDGIYHRELMNGGTPWSNSKVWKDQNPISYAAQFKTPMLVTMGELDYRVPMNNALETWNVLQRQRIPGKLIMFPDENHWILKAENSRFFYSEVQDWLGKYLNP